jgi:hypothetical protein
MEASASSRWILELLPGLHKEVFFDLREQIDTSML